jgi:predicted enzyme related to lactoylglutathione lyase
MEHVMDRHGTFFWNELNTGDVEGAKQFFEITIGWTFNNMPTEQGDYWVASMNGIPQAGLVPLDLFAPPGAPPHWFSYLAVDNVDERLQGLIAAGGTIVRPPFDVADVGRVAIVKDPTGAVMGWMTPMARG